MMHIHTASQIKASKHSKTLLELIMLRVNRNLVEHIVHETIDTVNKAIESPSSSRGRCKTRHPKANDFAEFAVNVIGRAEVPIAGVVTLVYINRSRPHLFVEAEEWAFHRVFLGVLILASKESVFSAAIPALTLLVPLSHPTGNPPLKIRSEIFPITMRLTPLT
ncbi:hypothetical protein BJ322DRAFT_1043064 [Thelephora terrestris]|uniref:Uncharacterized protein n=1 Tax=Thelephora terrestris TaxID=56493 RepID=A0A9P6HLA0_9AGAM|nr:hypothetical protein BJ322DRAFT_1043064 [Thelephora terrestris]